MRALLNEADTFEGSIKGRAGVLRSIRNKLSFIEEYETTPRERDLFLKEAKRQFEIVFGGPPESV